MSDNKLLEEKQTQLYRPGQPVSSGIPQPTPPSPPPPPPSPQQVPPPSSPSSWQWIDKIPLQKALWGLGILVLITIAIIFWRGFFRFDQHRVDISLEPNDNVPTGVETEWKVTLKNRNLRALSEGELTFTFPEQSFSHQTGERLTRTTVSVPSLGGWGEHTAIFRSVLVAGERKDAKVEYSFNQKSSSTKFERSETIGISPAELPIQLTLSVPEETLSGEEIEIKYMVKNEADIELQNTRVRLVYPLNFIVTRSSVPLENASTFWVHEKIGKGEEKEISVYGRVSGGSGESRIFRAFFEGKIGETTWEKYVEASSDVDLAQTPLDISVNVSPTVEAGETLSYRIIWKNNFEVGLSHLAIAAGLSGQMIDFASLDADGSFNARTGTVTFSEAHLPELAFVGPGAGGEVAFRVRTLRDYVPTGVTNPSVHARIEASSPTVPEGLTTAGVRAIQETETRIEGALLPQASVLYNETLAPIKNSGPYPPRLGSDTTFTVHWKLSGRANLFDSVHMKAQLPSGVEWSGETFVNGQYGNISYNSFTREVSWDIPELKPNQGLVSQIPEAVFKIKALPAPSQQGKAMDLLGETMVTGHDSFADVTVSATAPPLSSDIGESDGKVQ